MRRIGITKKRIIQSIAVIIIFLLCICIIKSIRGPDKEIQIYENIYPIIYTAPILPPAGTYNQPTIIKEQTVDIEYIFENITVPEGDRGYKKTYMDYRTITNTSSPQYALQQLSTTDYDGFRRFQGKYMVALGSYYTGEIGDEYIIHFDTGSIIAVLGDFKQDRHTDHTNRYVPHNGNIVEFIVDTDVLCIDIQTSGDVSEVKETILGRVTVIQKIMVK